MNIAPVPVETITKILTFDTTSLTNRMQRNRLPIKQETFINSNLGITTFHY